MVKATSTAGVIAGGNSEPIKKKPKKSTPTTTTTEQCSDVNDTDGATTELIILDTVWMHYCNFFSIYSTKYKAEDDEDDDDDDDDGETDALEEILEILKNKLPETFDEVWDFQGAIDRNGDLLKTNRRQLLPLMISVVSTILADECIDQCMSIEQQVIAMDGYDSTIMDPQRTSIQELVHEKNMILNTIRQHLLRALKSYPNNAAAIQMTTNYIRMTATAATTKNTGAPLLSTASTSASTTLLPLLAKLYAYAADVASNIRTTTIYLLSNDVNDDDDATQDWIIALLLNQVCAVTDVPTDNYDEDNDDDDDKEAGDAKEENSIMWSSSKVEGISRYMSAMMYSMTQQHDVAVQQLQLLHITHRLHPMLWQTAMKRPIYNVNSDDSTTPILSKPNPLVSTDDSATRTTAISTVQPMSFRGENGVMPQHLYDRLCHIFCPNAHYWYESSYSSRGYFSFYIDIDGERMKKKEASEYDNNTVTARNVIDDVVCNYLLPLIQNQPEYKSEQGEIIGYEWWVHTREMSANLGHNLHFDTDETSLQRDGTISHPTVSSILYLTGGGGDDDSGSTGSSRNYQGGPTIILDQTPESTTNAERVWYSHPINNSFTIFPGNLLHGVLPCLDRTTAEVGTPVSLSTTGDESLSQTLVKLLSDETTQNVTADSTKNASDTSSPNRLTLMIGFWTRNVPKDMGPNLTIEDRLYGPCSPLPSEENAKWVQELCAGYGAENTKKTPLSDVPSKQTTDVSKEILAVPLPCVSPAWEEISSPNGIDSDITTSTTKAKISSETNASLPPSSLTIPNDIDHRFFVIDAPGCFKSQLIDAKYCIDAVVDYSYDEGDDDLENDE